MVTTSSDFGTALTAAFQGGYVAQLTGQTYTITSPIIIHITGNFPGPVGIDGGGATLISQVTNGAPLIEIIADPGVSLRYLTLSNFTIAGNGGEGDGIQIVADGNDRAVYDFSVNNVNVQNVGGYGIDVRGNVFEGMVSNSWMSGNHLGGAYFTDTASGGIASALRWFGGGFQNNGGAGLTLDNGVRDMAVENASFLNNNGPGIDAMSGITAVSDSTFVNNLGVGVDFQNYGNFDNNTFSTSGSQTIGMSAYLVNTATLVNNTSTYTGGGSDPTELANMRGPGGLFLAGDSGHIVTEASVQTSPILADVSIGTQGVAVPSLAPVTAATTAAAASSTGTSALETALKTAFASDTVAHLTAATYTVSKTIVINVTASMQGPVGIDLGGAKIFSQITDGSPVIEIIVGPGVNLNGLTLSNFLIEGTGQEGDGIKIVADGSDRSVQNATFSNLELEGLGGIGLDVLGNVSHGTVFDSWMNANAQGGARFANSAHGGVASGLEWTGGGFRQNGGAGLILDNGTHDMTVKGAYFVDNHGPGIDATSGLTLVQGSGFENNQGTGAIVQGSATFNGDTFSTYGPQTTGIGAYLAGGQVSVIGDLAEYYGAGSPTIPLADVQGQGTLAIAGNGPVVVGPQVVVTGGTGALTTVVEAQGSTSLVLVGNDYFLFPVGGSSGPPLLYNGALVAVGEFGAWMPIGAEKTASGYEVAWNLTGADQYQVWSTDSSGNFQSTTGIVSGSSSTLQVAESSFHQDLNGDGVTGPHTTVIEAQGSTSLAQVADAYFLFPVGGSSGPELSYNGAPVTVGEFGTWVPIGGEKTATGYEVAWHLSGADQYVVWNTDSSGNYQSSIGIVSGGSSALQSAESSFHQDLNGDGVTGPHTTVIEAQGSTSLVQVADAYFLFPVGGSSGPELSYNGAPVTVGEFGTWVPIGGEKTATGYEVAWHLSGADQYVVWNTDSSGNYQSSIGIVSGGSSALQSAESSFHQDLNGDGVTGPHTTVIEAQGSTSLAQVADDYFLFPVGGSSGPELSYNGTPVTVGEFGTWVPIGGEKTATGYEVAWHLSGADQYVVWNTDSSGNYQSSIGIVSGGSSALQSAESSFHQDLNGDGVTGLHTTVIETQGSTSLVQVADDYFLYPIGGSSGPELNYNGAPVTVGEFGGTWVPIGAEKTATGYEVAWHVTGADQYSVWNTDSSGNFQSSIGIVSGGSSALQSAESSFHQDLNGDGVTGLHTTVIETQGSTSLVQVANNYFLFPVGGSSGPELNYNGAPVTVGEFGTWAPVAVEKTASGFEVAWHLTGVDQYVVWNTDSSGNFQSSIGIVSGSSPALGWFLH